MIYYSWSSKNYTLVSIVMNVLIWMLGIPSILFHASPGTLKWIRIGSEGHTDLKEAVFEILSAPIPWKHISQFESILLVATFLEKFPFKKKTPKIRLSLNCIGYLLNKCFHGHWLTCFRSLWPVPLFHLPIVTLD